MSEDELAAAFAKGQQELLESFKLRLKDVADKVISDFYTDVTNYAATDASTNYFNFLRDEFRESIKTEILIGGGHYSWASSIRMELLEKHPGPLKNKIIEDLKEKIKHQDERYAQIMEMRRF